MHRSLAVLATLAAYVATASAQEMQTITHRVPVQFVSGGTSLLQGSTTFSVPRFSSTLGQLKAVRLVVNAQGYTRVPLFNPSPQPIQDQFLAQYGFALGIPDPANPSGPICCPLLDSTEIEVHPVSLPAERLSYPESWTQLHQVGRADSGYSGSGWRDIANHFTGPGNTNLTLGYQVATDLPATLEYAFGWRPQTFQFRGVVQVTYVFIPARP